MRLDAKIHYLRDYRDVLEPAAACVRERGAASTPSSRSAGARTTRSSPPTWESTRRAITKRSKRSWRPWTELPPEPSVTISFCAVLRIRSRTAARRSARRRPSRTRLGRGRPARSPSQSLFRIHLHRLVPDRLRAQWASWKSSPKKESRSWCKAEHVAVLAEILGWRAVSECYRDHRDAGASFLANAAAKQNALQTPPRPGYFAARVAYYDVGRNWPKHCTRLTKCSPASATAANSCANAVSAMSV